MNYEDASVSDFQDDSASPEENSNIWQNPKVQELLKRMGTAKQKAEQANKALDDLSETRRLLAAQRSQKQNEKQEKVTDIHKKYEELKQKAIADATAALDAEFAKLTDEYNSATNKKYEFESEYKQAKDLKNSLEKELEKVLEELRIADEFAELDKQWEQIKAHAAWKDYIHEYQQYGAKRMVLAKRALNGDEMGLGKTLQCIAAINMTDEEFSVTPAGDMLAPDQRGCLWITRKNALYNTMEEFKKWYPGRLFAVLQGNPVMRATIAEAAYNSGAVLLVNYEGLQSTPNIMYLDPDAPEAEKEQLSNRRVWNRVICDEAHQFRTEGGLKFQNVKRVAHVSKYFWALSGTPFLNHASELWATLHMIDPEKYKRKYKFTEEFCNYGNEEYINSYMVDQLMKSIQRFVFRRRKDEVALELPDLTRQFHYVEMTPAQREFYDRIRDQFSIKVNDTEPGKPVDNAAAWLMRLRQAADWPPAIQFDNPDAKGDEKLSKIAVDVKESAKIDECMTIIEELTADGEKAVVFCVLNEPLKEVVRRCNELGIAAEYYDGSLQHLQAVVEAFQEDDKPQVLCMNVKKAEAINLYRASHAIFLDLWWNAPTNEQAEARLHRIGQKNAVISHIIHAVESVDNFIAKKIEMKETNFKSVFERDELRRAIDEGLI